MSNGLQWSGQESPLAHKWGAGGASGVRGVVCLLLGIGANGASGVQNTDRSLD